MRDLFSTLISDEQLVSAWEKVAENAGSPGGDGVTIQKFQRRLEQNIRQLQAQLRDGDYFPGPLRAVDIPKRDGGQRRLNIPCIRDRIAQTAVAQLLDPVLDPLFSPDSFAYRSGRSVDMAVRRVDALRRQGYGWVAESDIRRCFDSIPHEPLLVRLSEVLRDHPGQEDMLDLIALWLEHFGAEMDTPGIGLSQGSPIAPLLCNFYLDQFDDGLAEIGIRCVRFADDFVLLAKTEAQAHNALGHASGILREHGLELHGDKTRVVPFDEGMEFLGHLFIRSMVLRQVSDPDEGSGRLLKAAPSAALPADVPKHDAEAYRVLYLTEDDLVLDLRNLSFSIQREGHEVIAVHPEAVARVEVGPDATVTDRALRQALAAGTELAFVNGRGETKGWLRAPDFDRAGLHLAQARLCLDPKLSVDMARRLVGLRLRNMRAQLHRLNRRSRDTQVIAATAGLGRILRKLPDSGAVPELMGQEGAAAALYWPALGRLCGAVQGNFMRQRPARDALNAAINYLTAMLERDIHSAILRAGLHPGFGLLHTPRDRHEACVYDLMEGFRAPLTEGVAVTLFNQSRLREQMFDVCDDSVRIDRDGIRALITGYERTVSRKLRSVHSGQQRTWRAIMLEEARAFGRHCSDPTKNPFEGQVLDY